MEKSIEFPTLAAPKPMALQPLSLTGQRWERPCVIHSAALSEPAFTSQDALPCWLVDCLAHRGMEGQSVLERYLRPSLADLEDPASMAGMPQALRRLVTALETQEPMVVYGDYDADGVCATALLVTFLRQMGGQVFYHIPNRRTEGYGLNKAALSEWAQQARLLITADCGTTAHAELEWAQQLGLEVIIVDHHQVDARLPHALACLNPHRPDCQFPFKDLCATGVAFMLVAALRRALRESSALKHIPPPDIRALLDLVALATVADMVPLYQTNRILVAAGLRQLRQAPRPGLAALCNVAKVHPKDITASDLGFRLGPRVNARGRMEHAAQAVELMLTPSLDQAQALAQELDCANTRRREVEKSTLAEALDQIQSQALQQDAALVICNPRWHAGILGLVASRLVRQFHRPVVVIGEGGKGSARSIEGLNLHAALSTTAPYLIRFGGHPAAAGLTVEPQHVESFRQCLLTQVQKELGDPPFVPVLRPEVQMDPLCLNLALVESIERMAPFGQGNPEPLFMASHVTVRHKRVVGENHLKLRLGPLDHDAIGFGLGSLLPHLTGLIDAAFYVERHTYAGRTAFQMRLVDIRNSHGPG